MQLILYRDVSLDKVNNLRQYILRYTVRSSLMSLNMSHSLDDVQIYAAGNALIWDETVETHKNGDNHIQNLNMGRYIVGYSFGNHPLRLRSRVAVKLNFRPYIRQYISPN